MRHVEVKHDWNLDPYDWPLLRAPNYNGIIHITNTSNKWELGLDAVAFRPEEIKVSIKPHENGHDLLVDGTHAQRKDELGSIARTIHRIVHIPSDVDTNTIVANLSPNGLLTINAKKKSP